MVELMILLLFVMVDTTLYKAPEELQDNHLILMAGTNTSTNYNQEPVLNIFSFNLLSQTSSQRATR
jgi:hypothetical protein